ncbi:ribosome modulation factor [Colwellia psychrerythraea]|uniref:Ribosome modulation factor n=1 Tax=Colwellia psychrerythraea TaxID=28229 RepID=A0A099KPN0_COLPS|nr:ribosome modulation factor [Colwellia psychrerythraea]KGJ92135.1 ribosome modulation factor [Colwellia psychrerythraea]
MPSIKLKATFEEGQNAALCGKTLDNCPYRKTEKKNAWVRGFHQGKLAKENGGKSITPVQARTNQGHIAHLRSLFH